MKNESLRKRIGQVEEMVAARRRAADPANNPFEQLSAEDQDLLAQWKETESEAWTRGEHVLMPPDVVAALQRKVRLLRAALVARGPYQPPADLGARILAAVPRLPSIAPPGTHPDSGFKPAA